MLISVKQLKADGPAGENSLDFSYGLDMSQVRQWGHAPFREPVMATGTVANHLGILTLAYTASFARICPCARCLAPVRATHTLRLSHTVMEQLQDESSDPEAEFILAADGMLDLDELITADILLSQEGVALCSEDCKGLCPKCGINLNETTCSCSAKRPDSPFAALLEFMEETNE